MSDEPPVTVPPLVAMLANDLSQKALTTLATTLSGAGYIAPNHTAQMVSYGVAAILWALSFGWTILGARFRRAKLNAALNQPVSSTGVIT